LETAIVIADAPQPILERQAQTDQQLIALWLHGRSRHTQRAYRHDIDGFLSFVNQPLHGVTLGDVQLFADGLAVRDLELASQHRALSAVKSLFSFGHRLGYLPFDVARPLRLPKLRDNLSERILSEGEVQRMIALEPKPRNQVLLLTLYATGVRVSELCGLCWSDLQPRNEGQGQANVFGKGGKTRVILLPASVWLALSSIREDSQDEGPVFRSRRGRSLHPSQVMRIVKAAARRAGILKNVSPHWLRHGHASHALDRGCPIHLVQATLGHSSVATTGRYLHARPTDSSSNYLPI
jgi:site-specific recombinase XerD